VLSKEAEGKGKKRIFVTLLIFSLLLLVGLATLFLFLALNRAPLLNFWFNILVMAAIAGVFLLCSIGMVMLLITLYSKKKPGKIRIMFTRIVLGLYPMALQLGHFVGISNEAIWTSFVELNNQLVFAYHKKVPADRLLLLLPHCLQRSECSKKVTIDINNCVNCGLCDIGKLKVLCEETGIHGMVSTGGTLARQAVKNVRPKAAVAVACGRDLFSGIMDVRPLPTLGVLNERPEGPCHNTRVDVEKVKEMVQYFLSEETVQK